MWVANRIAKAGIQNTFLSSPMNPYGATSSKLKPISLACDSRYFLTKAVSKLSLPAVTGVCVVKTVVARIKAAASEKLRLS